jgi:hypothetical protein
MYTHIYKKVFTRLNLRERELVLRKEGRKEERKEGRKGVGREGRTVGIKE